jgi:hypothetical protein
MSQLADISDDVHAFMREAAKLGALLARSESGLRAKAAKLAHDLDRERPGSREHERLQRDLAAVGEAVSRVRAAQASIKSISGVANGWLAAWGARHGAGGGSSSGNASVQPKATVSERPSVPLGSGLVVSRTNNGGYNLLPDTDSAGKLASRVAGLPGYTDVVVHGNATEFGTHDGPGVSPEQLGDLVSSISADSGEAIRLLACKSGELDNGAAQRVADRLGTPVMAATDTVHVRSRADGSVRLLVGPNPFTPSGKWRIFEPRGGKQ